MKKGIGLPVFPGVAIGPAVVYRKAQRTLPVSSGDPAVEKAKFSAALDVAREQLTALYEKARAEVEGFMINNEQYKFSILGTFACKLGIEWKRKNKYFCSQFVAEILNRSGAAKLPKAASLMRPMDCAELEGMNLVFEGNIGQLKETIRNKEPVTL